MIGEGAAAIEQGREAIKEAEGVVREAKGLFDLLRGKDRSGDKERERR